MHNIRVSLAFALPKRQWQEEYTVARGTTAGELIEKSGFLKSIDALSQQTLSDLSLGVFAQKVTLDTLLEDGDRVEIYRPLTADPKEVRRQLALLGKTMGSKPKEVNDVE